jgi:hypothetical protein
MGTHQHTYNFNEQFEFSGKPKTWSLIAILIGVIAIAYGFIITGSDRAFANLLLMSYYFTCVCAAGAVFLGIQLVSQSAWSAGFLRVPQAFASVLPIASLILLVICTAGLFSGNLYDQWFAEGLTDPNSPNYDALVAGKAVYLNAPAFLIREIVFLGSYSICAFLLAKYSYKEDLQGGMTFYKKNFKLAAIFLVVFGFTSPIWIFDTIMSLEAHWFSTMFGWYNFAAMYVSALSAITLIVILLKRAGHMNWVNENHMHDMGKLIFGFSIFWCYLWFSQFMLIWYANMPEETVYFYKRWEPEYKPWFWLNIVINFVVPVLFLINRPFVRNMKFLGTICVILLAGHWLDYYMMIMPGTVEQNRGFGIVEIGTAIGFVGLFTFLVLNKLGKQGLVPKNHPFLEESLHHQV